MNLEFQDRKVLANQIVINAILRTIMTPRLTGGVRILSVNEGRIKATVKPFPNSTTINVQYRGFSAVSNLLLCS